MGIGGRQEIDDSTRKSQGRSDQDMEGGRDDDQMHDYSVCWSATMASFRTQKKLNWIDTDFTQWVVDLNINRSTPKTTSSGRRKLLHVGGGGGTSDNLNQFTGNGGLTLTVVQDLEPMAMLGETTYGRGEYTYLLIISPAFLEAFSMALRRA